MNPTKNNINPIKNKFVKQIQTNLLNKFQLEHLQLRVGALAQANTQLSYSTITVNNIFFNIIIIIIIIITIIIINNSFIHCRTITAPGDAFEHVKVLKLLIAVDFHARKEDWPMDVLESTPGWIGAGSCVQAFV